MYINILSNVLFPAREKMHADPTFNDLHVYMYMYTYMYLQACALCLEGPEYLSKYELMTSPAEMLGAICNSSRGHYPTVI